MQTERVTREDMLKYGPDIGKIRGLEREIRELRGEVIRLKIKCGEQFTHKDIFGFDDPTKPAPPPPSVISEDSMAQHWIGSTDVNGMLLNIGGWAVDCYNDREARQAVQYALDQKWIQLRTHHTPDGDTWPAYELTDAGLEEVKALFGQKHYDEQVGRRQWYRDRVPQSSVHGQTPPNP